MAKEDYFGHITSAEGERLISEKLVPNQEYVNKGVQFGDSQSFFNARTTKGLERNYNKTRNKKLMLKRKGL